jgi:S-adenosylmethionine synthetase
MKRQIEHTSEHVSEGHPDKFCDQVADRILDRVLELAGDDAETRSSVRTAIECLAKDNLLIVSGEVNLAEHLTQKIKADLNIIELAREVWVRIGYGTKEQEQELTVIDHVRTQSKDIAKGEGTGIDAGGAGDQGIMVGYATDETKEMMPKEWVLARDICMKLADLRRDGTLPWLKSDCKSQVTLNDDGEVKNVIVAAHHAEDVTTKELREEISEKVLAVLLPGFKVDLDKINGTGRFAIGGPTGDAGVVGRKIVVDAYGPRIPVGGGAYSGKDPSKVDRSAAYMARFIAKTAVKDGIAKECLVHIAYGIGQKEPEMITAVSETGKDLSSWLGERFPKKDLWPVSIIEQLALRYPKGWSYLDTAAYGHYGREKFPWEQVG